MGVIKVHHTKVDTTGAWDGPAEVKKLQTPITGDVANGMFAYFESRGPDENKDGWPDNKDAYKFPHHNVVGSKPSDANLRGVNAALARIGQADLPVSNIAGIKEHLQAHKDDAESIGLSRSFMENPIKELVGYLSAFVEQISRLVVKRDVSLDEIWQAVQAQLDTENNVQPLPVSTDPADIEWEDENGAGSPARSAYVLDVRTDGAQVYAIITKSDGKLYKAPVAVGADSSIAVGDYVEVALEFAPTEGRQVTVKRQADGKVRWFALPACTAVLNRSGEIDSRDLFDSFVSTIERTGNYPKLDFYHKGEKLLLGQADWVARIGYSYCASGLFDETPIARAAIKSLEDDPEYWGLSIAYVPTQEPETIRSADGVSVNVYNIGINRFISLLPEKSAASIMTSITTNEGVNRMTKNEEDALKKLTGDDTALFEENKLKLDGIDREVEAENMVRRDDVTTKETHVIETTAPAPAPAVPAVTAPVETRAMTPEDMMTVLESAEFENKVVEIVKKLQAGEAQAPAADATQQQQIDEVSELRTAITALKTSLEQVSTNVASLTKTRGEQVQEILDDMPDKLKNQNRVIVRPRNVIMPVDLRREKVNLQAVAEETLAAINQK